MYSTFPIRNYPSFPHRRNGCWWRGREFDWDCIFGDAGQEYLQAILVKLTMSCICSQLELLSLELLVQPKEQTEQMTPLDLRAQWQIT